jgi:hypothetical protein
MRNSAESCTKENRSTAHNALASRMIIDQLTPLLPKDSEEVKCLQAILDAATMVDPTHERRDGGWGQDPEHRQIPCRDSASSLTPLEERGRERDWDNRDLCDIIRNRDALDRIKNWRQEQDHAEQKRHHERDYDCDDPIYNEPHRQCSPEGGHNEGGVKAFSHDLKRVWWPLNF